MASLADRVYAVEKRADFVLKHPGYVRTSKRLLKQLAEIASILDIQKQLLITLPLAVRQAEGLAMAVHYGDIVRFNLFRNSYSFETYMEGLIRGRKMKIRRFL